MYPSNLYNLQLQKILNSYTWNNAHQLFENKDSTKLFYKLVCSCGCVLITNMVIESDPT